MQAGESEKARHERCSDASRRKRPEMMVTIERESFREKKFAEVAACICVSWMGKCSTFSSPLPDAIKLALLSPTWVGTSSRTCPARISYLGMKKVCSLERRCDLGAPQVGPQVGLGAASSRLRPPQVGLATSSKSDLRPPPSAT